MSASAPLLTFFSPHHAQHNPPHEFMHGRLVPFFEMPARVEALRQGLAAAGLLRLVEPELRVRPADLAQVHDPAMLTYFEQLSAGVVVEVQKFFAAYHLQHEVDENVYFYESMFPRRTYGAAAPSRYFIYDSVSPIGRHSWTAILHSANLAHAGALALLAGEPRAYALCRPPGHHAGRDFAGGYCYVNNAAVAAAALRSLGRVAVIDVDYHHGNGTQDIFWHTPEVMLLSLHGDPAFEYPHYAGAASETGAGNILNLPLPAGTDEMAYLAALTAGLARVQAFDPAAVVVSLGFDTYKEDPIAEFKLDMPAYYRMGALLAGLHRPTLYVQEGGYRTEKLGELAAAFFKGVLGLPF